MSDTMKTRKNARVNDPKIETAARVILADIKKYARRSRREVARQLGISVGSLANYELRACRKIAANLCRTHGVA